MILQKTIPYDTTPRKLPGIQPLKDGEWLSVDEAYAGQMQRRLDLLTSQRADVLQLSDAALPVAQELLDHVLSELPAGIARQGDLVHCPDGRVVQIDRQDPLGTLGQICQEDFCILAKQGAEHVLTGAVLCFPASWTLAQKFLKPLLAIHIPVKDYDDNLARRVQRLFDGIQVGRGLWRFNALMYDDPELYQPRTEDDPRPLGGPEARYFRSERQSMIRLPQSRAVIFAIHTYVVDQGPQPVAASCD